IAFEHFGFLGWTWRDKHMGSKLPLCLEYICFLVILCLRVTQPGTFASGRRPIVPSPTRYVVSNLCRIVAACALNPPPSPPPIPPQDILEHRFAHIRAGLGTLRNPTAAQAKE
ncbi:unnamed protein product, partial [Pylaiella littoralis]